MLRLFGLGLIAGAGNDDPSAIGTFASAGARFGPALLWTAPLTLPLMYVAVYLSSKLGKVAGQGLFSVVYEHYPRWVLWPLLAAVLIGNTVEAAADIGGMAAAIMLFLPLPYTAIVIGVALTIFVLQVWGSYTLIRNVFRWLSLTLLAYAGSAVLANPDIGKIAAGTLLPRIEFTGEFLAMLVAIIGTRLSAYLYPWQASAEVEEEIEKGRTRLSERQGASRAELKTSRQEILFGMFFSNLIVYFVMMATGATLYESGKHDISAAAEAAEALRPLAGEAAGALFAAGIIGVGFLAVPIMTTGAAYCLAPIMGWKHSLHARPAEAKKFYVAIGVFTLLAVGLNFLGINPMKALVWAGIVQGLSAPILLLLMMLMTNNRAIVGDKVNSRWTNLLGWTATVVTFGATLGLVATWVT